MHVAFRHQRTEREGQGSNISYFQLYQFHCEALVNLLALEVTEWIITIDKGSSDYSKPGGGIHTVVQISK